MSQHVFPRDAAGRVFKPLNGVQHTRVKVSPDTFLYSFYGWYESTIDPKDRGDGYQAVFLWPWDSTQAMEELPLGLGKTDRGSLWAGDGSVLLSYFIGPRLYTAVIPGFTPYRPAHTHEASVRLT